MPPTQAYFEEADHARLPSLDGLSRWRKLLVYSEGQETTSTHNLLIALHAG